MSGGPSQLETFDPKEGQPNGGPTKAIDTRVPGIRIAENLPKIAGIMEHLAVIRSMSTKEGDHTRATHFMRTGYLPQGPIQYPSLGAFLGKQLKKQECDLPSYVSINPFRGFSVQQRMDLDFWVRHGHRWSWHRKQTKTGTSRFRSAI